MLISTLSVTQGVPHTASKQGASEGHRGSCLIYGRVLCGCVFVADRKLSANHLGTGLELKNPGEEKVASAGKSRKTFNNNLQINYKQVGGH